MGKCTEIASPNICNARRPPWRLSKQDKSRDEYLQRANTHPEDLGLTYTRHMERRDSLMVQSHGLESRQVPTAKHYRQGRRIHLQALSGSGSKFGTLSSTRTKSYSVPRRRTDMAAASESSGSFLKEQQAKAARLRDATDAAAAFKGLESHAGHVFKVSGPCEKTRNAKEPVVAGAAGAVTTLPMSPNSSSPAIKAIRVHFVPILRQIFTFYIHF